MERVISGGFPEAVARQDPARRNIWLRAYTEIAKAAALHGEPTAIGRYRDKDGAEVDLVLERFPGEVVGIKVKAGATVRPDDFKALVRLQAAAGDQFACGILLRDGERIQQTASRMYAMPIKMLWES